MRRMRLRKKRHWRLFFLTALLLTAVVALWLRISPVIEELAVAEVADEASNQISEAITAQMELDDISYESIISLEKDGDGKLLALRTDMNEINHLRNETLQIINERFSSCNASELGIPLGNVIFPALFSGKGPMLPIRVLTIRNADAEFTSHFQEAGINQTLHQITLNVALDITMLSPAGTETFRVESGVVVAETVLIGQVPNTLVTTHNQKTEMEH